MGDLVWSQKENFPVIRMVNYGARNLFHILLIPFLCRVVQAEAWLF